MLLLPLMFLLKCDMYLLLSEIYELRILSMIIFLSVRLAFAGARRGHFPRVLALISIPYSTPVVSLILQVRTDI